LPYGQNAPGHRNSAENESVDAQATVLANAGCKKAFREVHVSGGETDCADLRRVIEALIAGDVLMVTRLARSTRKAGFRSWATHGPTPPNRMGG
jgi:DNA invertase Pin-like site-specific DNA recombinase